MRREIVFVRIDAYISGEIIYNSDKTETLKVSQHDPVFLTLQVSVVMLLLQLLISLSLNL